MPRPPVTAHDGFPAIQLSARYNTICAKGDARRPRPLLEQRDGEAVLTVEDDGRGYDPEAEEAAGADKGVGVTDMRERAAIVGGALEVESAPGADTTVFVRVPARRRRRRRQTVVSDSKVRVLIAEDHGTMREGLRLLLDGEPDMEVVGEAADGREALRLARELQPDVALMDVSMPGVDGLQATRQLHETCPRVRVLALTRHDDYGFMTEMLRAGAKGYVLKQGSSAELLLAVRAVAAGHNYLDPRVTARVVGSYSSAQPAGEGGKTASEREEEVLRLIALGHSNKEIAARLALSVKTVEAHKANGMRKLGLTGRADIVSYAIFRGWMKND